MLHRLTGHTHRAYPVPLADVLCEVARVDVRAPAGFPSPADDYLEDCLDLHGYLVRRPAATYVMQVDGDSMKGAGILSGDLVVIDKAEEPTPGKIVTPSSSASSPSSGCTRTRPGSTGSCPRTATGPSCGRSAASRSASFGACGRRLRPALGVRCRPRSP